MVLHPMKRGSKRNLACVFSIPCNAYAHVPKNERYKKQENVFSWDNDHKERGIAFMTQVAGRSFTVVMSSLR